MSLIDKFLDVMRLNDDDEDDDYEYTNDEYLDDDDYDVPKKKTPRREQKVEPKQEYREREREPEKPREVVKPTSKITPIGKAQKKGTGNGNMEVCVIKPNSIEDEVEITDTLLSGRTVIINMEGLNVEIAQRIIDFVSGSAYAIHGKLQKISNFIFLATPNGVDISGDIQNLMDTFGTNDGGFTL